MKSVGAAYVFWIFGIHYLYFGKPFVFLLYFLTGGGLFIWAIFDFFDMPRKVNSANRKEAKKLAQ